MPDNLIAIYSVYNEAVFIEDSVRRVSPWVGRIHLFDGAYKEFPHAFAYSSDGTLDKALRANPSVLVTPPPAGGWENQIVKRTTSLQALRPGEFALTLDGDMYLANPEVLETLDYASMDVGWAIVRSPIYAYEYRIPVIFRYTPGMHYAGRHHWLFDGEGRLISSHQRKTSRYRHVDIPLIMYNQIQRTSEQRKRQKRIFQESRNPREARYSSENDVYKNNEDLIPHEERAQSPRQNMHRVRSSEKEPTYSLCIPISRPWAVDRWCAWFKDVEIPWAETEIIVALDNDDPTLLTRLKHKLATEVAPEALSIKVWFSKEAKLPETCKTRLRRARICRNWIIFLTEARGSIMLGAEDDTLPDKDAYTKLVRCLHEEKASFVQGTELGRWGCQMYPHWQITEENGEVIRTDTALPAPGQNLIEIQGGGWYCFAARMEDIKACSLTWTADPPLGPDLKFVYELHKAGKRCLGMWDVKCIHFGEDFDLHPDTSSVHFLSRRKVNNSWTNEITLIREGFGEQSYSGTRRPQKIKVDNTKGRNQVDPASRQTCNVYVEALGTVHTGSHVYGMVFRGARFWTTDYMARKLGRKVRVLTADEYPQETPTDAGPSRMPLSGPETGHRTPPGYQTKEN